MADEELPPYVIPIKGMREPTALELAELITIQSQATMAMVRYLLIERDILSEDEEHEEASDDLNESLQMIQHWWLTLKPDDPQVPGFDNAE